VKQLDDIYQEIDNARNATVLVEGPKDKRSLERLGFTNVIHLHGPLYQMVEEIEGEDEVLVLTDLDSHGRHLYKYFYNELTRRGVKVNNKLRLMLFATPVRQIEGLANFLNRMEVMAQVAE
jgi:5S rRNA maturation endonuclease (ribonuclease M5)